MELLKHLLAIRAPLASKEPAGTGPSTYNYDSQPWCRQHWNGAGPGAIPNRSRNKVSNQLRDGPNSRYFKNGFFMKNFEKNVFVIYSASFFLYYPIPVFDFHIL